MEKTLLIVGNPATPEIREAIEALKLSGSGIILVDSAREAEFIISLQNLTDVEEFKKMEEILREEKREIRKSMPNPRDKLFGQSKKTIYKSSLKRKRR